MMMSPESYYSVYLKDTSEGEIREKMHELKESIGYLRNLIATRSPDSISYLISPGPETTLYWKEKYLEITKKTLADMGAEDILSEYLKKAETFQENLNFLKKITWSMGGYLGEGRIHIVESNENTLLYSSKKGYGGMDPDFWGDFSLYTTEQMKSIPKTKSELLAVLVPYCIGEWDDDYCDPLVLDGMGWSVTFDFSDEIPSAKFKGYHKTPDNFYDLYHRIFGDN